MTPWHALTPDEVFKVLGSSDAGLDEAEAGRRLISHGPNALPEKARTPPVIVFLRQFASPLIYVLLFAAIVEIVILNKPLDAVVILVVVVLNSVIGFFQERKAEQAMEALKRMVAPMAAVRRQGRIARIPAKDLVPGDMVVFEAGDRVPADARVIQSAGLRVDESPLTGESAPVDKNARVLHEATTLADRTNMVHMATVVGGGRGMAVVTATGGNTEVGKISASVQEVKHPPTPLQVSIARLGRYIGIIVVFIILVLVAQGVVGGYTFAEMFTLGIAAAVSAIPEGLPVMVTVVLALGMRRMARRNAIVRKLAAVETLGTASVICSDKTGTFTENEMTVSLVYLDGRRIEVTGEGYRPEGEFVENGARIDPLTDPQLAMALRAGALCNNSIVRHEKGTYSLLGDPTEGALLTLAMKAGLDIGALQKEFPREVEQPFESERRFMATLHRIAAHEGGITFVKGSIDRVLEMSSHIFSRGETRELTLEVRSTIELANETMALEALRVIGLAYLECPPERKEDLCLENKDRRAVFLGLAGMMDPPRSEARGAVAACGDAGIKVVMITGDHRTTAAAIGRQLGLPEGDTVTGAELDRMSGEELKARASNISIFARVEPLQKLKIVDAYKASGHVVAMTGDGVNDAPALRAANIGIAMGIKGTDVAKEAADMVLADDNFASIVAAVEEGRVIFDNIRRSIFFLLSTNLGELFTLMTALAIGLPLPVVAVQVLWINLVTDGACTIPLGIEPKAPGVLKRVPRGAATGITYRGMWLRTLFLAVVMAAGSIWLFQWQLSRSGIEQARTIAFCALVAFQWANALNARSETDSLFKLGLWGNRWLLAGIGLAVLLQLAVVYVPGLQTLFYTVPLRAGDWLLIAATSLSIIAVEEVRKRIAPGLFLSGR